MALTPEGAWVARVDGAWLWQIELPAPPPPEPAEPPAPGSPAPTPLPPPAVVGPLQWTPQSTLLLTGSDGLWYEAVPARVLASPLPAALQGTTGLAFSPDGSQVLYFKGPLLYTALRDGSQPKLIGENLTGYWRPDGQLVTAKASQPVPQTLPDPSGIEMERE